MDLHRERFDAGTQAKLALYRDYVREWLPVFVQASWVETVQIFDFFAGPGQDVEGNPGSPIIAVEEMSAHWDTAEKHGISVKLFLNEFSPAKFKALAELVAAITDDNPRLGVVASNRDFAESFHDWVALMKQPKTASLVFLDQNGVKQITPEVFRTIVQLPKTDFLHVSYDAWHKDTIEPIELT